jgi:aminoglycoside phosphotransferase
LSMSGEVAGQAVNAVLAPPQAERFAGVADVDLGRLVLNVTGRNKLVLLDSDRVFLFPRSAIGVEWFERELAAYQGLAKTQLGVVPRLLGRWEDPEIYPFPFAAVTRLRGEVPAEPEALIEQLGEAIACWHELEPPALAGARPPCHHDAAHHRWLRRALDPATSAEAAAEAANRLGRPGRASAWADLLASAAQLAPVLVHGDIHEDQLLADGGRLTGIIDWETARVDHPFWDFDLGEWVPSCGAAAAATSAPCGRGGGARMPRHGGWKSVPARCRPPFASGTRLVFSPIPAIRLSSARSKSTSRSYSSPSVCYSCPSGCWCRVLVLPSEPGGTTDQAARQDRPGGDQAT